MGGDEEIPPEPYAEKERYMVLPHAEEARDTSPMFDMDLQYPGTDSLEVAVYKADNDLRY